MWRYVLICGVMSGYVAFLALCGVKWRYVELCGVTWR